MGDISVGDKVVDGNGEMTDVTGVFPQGSRPIYSITLSDRTSFKVSDEHINSVFLYDAGSRKVKRFELTTIDLIKLLEESKYTIRVDIPKVTCWEDKKLLVDPYLLGFLIADGSLHDNHNFSNCEGDVISKIKSKLNAVGYGIRKASGADWSIHRNDGLVFNQHTADERSIWWCLRQYGLDVLSSRKSIPKDYLLSSYETRLSLLQGLFDGDGHVSKKGVGYEYTTSSKQLSDDFAFLVRSLGIVDTVVVRESAYRNDGVSYKCKLSYRHTLQVPNDMLIFSSEKHGKNWKLRTYAPIRRIVNITYVGEEPCQCISVDSDYKTYITDNFTPTHNTTVAKKAVAQFQNTCKNCLHTLSVCSCGNTVPHKAVYVDIEGAFDPLWFQSLGGVLDDLLLLQPEFAEEAVDIVEALVRTGEVDIIVVDSVAMMSPATEIDKSSEDLLVGTHARLMNRMMRSIQAGMNSLGMTNEQKPTVILINQIRKNVGVMYGNTDTYPGGLGQKFASSITVKFTVRPSELIYEDGKKKEEAPIAVQIRFKVEKNKTFLPFRSGMFTLHISNSPVAEKGSFNTEEQIVDYGIRYGFIERSGAWFTPKVTVEGIAEQFQGKDAVINELIKNEDFKQILADHILASILEESSVKVEGDDYEGEI
jgi:protein RecA